MILLLIDTNFTAELVRLASDIGLVCPAIMIPTMPARPTRHWLPSRGCSFPPT